MPNFILASATPADCESIIRLEFAACAEDPAFSLIYPKGATPDVVLHYTRQMKVDLASDPTCMIAIINDADTGELASFAVWHFFENWHQDDLDKEMGKADFQLPADANVEVGNLLIGNGIRKRHEIMSTQAYAYLAALSTSLSYRKQGAASLLLEHFTKITDEKRLPAYVEATPAAVGIYRKYGFEQVDILRLELSRWKQGAYYNLCMIRRANPQSTP